MSAFTPGPWWWPFNNALASGDADEWTLVAGFSSSVIPKEADAALIAAAPELYEALNLLWLHVSPGSKLDMVARAALGKAGGET